MNTQTHLLLAAALLARSSKTIPNATPRTDQAASSTKSLNLAVLAGALLPDVSLFVMFLQAKARGVADEVIWGELYYSSLWQEIGAVTNSIPVYVFLMLIGNLLGGRLGTKKHIATLTNSAGYVLLFLGLAALLHCLTDLPLHVDDGHAHFWPFTDWIFASPVSYWDQDHYALYWQPVEIIIALVCVLVIWRRFSSVWVRIAAITGLLSFAMVILYWAFALG